MLLDVPAISARRAKLIESVCSSSANCARNAARSWCPVQGYAGGLIDVPAVFVLCGHFPFMSFLFRGKLGRSDRRSTTARTKGGRFSIRWLVLGGGGSAFQVELTTKDRTGAHVGPRFGCLCVAGLSSGWSDSPAPLENYSPAVTPRERSSAISCSVGTSERAVAQSMFASSEASSSFAAASASAQERACTV